MQIRITRMPIRDMSTNDGQGSTSQLDLVLYKTSSCQQKFRQQIPFVATTRPTLASRASASNFPLIQRKRGSSILIIGTGCPLARARTGEDRKRNSQGETPANEGRGFVCGIAGD
jgi:hypothetical protein